MSTTKTLQTSAPVRVQIPIEKVAVATGGGANDFGDGFDAEIVVEGYASTGEVDRHGDVVLPSAFKDSLPEFLTGGVILFNHDSDRPIGRPLAAEIRANGPWIRAAIYDADVARLIDRKVLKSFSIGASIPSADDVEVKDLGGGQSVLVIKRLDLVEVSVVSIPANKGARFDIADATRAEIVKSLAAVRSRKKEGGDHMLEHLRKLLGLPDTADEAEVLSRITEMATAAETGGAVAQALGLDPSGVNADAVRASLDAIRADTVSRADYDAIKAKALAAEVDAALAPHIARIPGDVIPLARELAAREDKSAFTALMKTLPTPPTRAGGTPPPPGSDDPAAEMTAEELQWMKSLGYFNDPKEYLRNANMTPEELLAEMFGGRR